MNWAVGCPAGIGKGQNDLPGSMERQVRLSLSNNCGTSDALETSA